LSPARIRRVHATLMSALGSAVKRKRIAYDPAAHVELASGRRPRAVVWTEDRVVAWLRTGVRPPVAVWTPGQAGAFLDVAATHRLYPLFHLIAYRGLRRGEAVGVRWEDLDAGLLRVSQQVVQLGWATEIGEPKSDSGARTVVLDAATVAVLRTWRTAQADEAQTWPGAWQDSGLVFTREDGSQLHPDMASSAFERLYRAAGLPPIRLPEQAGLSELAFPAPSPAPARHTTPKPGHQRPAWPATRHDIVAPKVPSARGPVRTSTLPILPAQMALSSITRRAAQLPLHEFRLRIHLTLTAVDCSYCRSGELPLPSSVLQEGTPESGGLDNPSWLP